MDLGARANDQQEDWIEAPSWPIAVALAAVIVGVLLVCLFTLTG